MISKGAFSIFEKFLQLHRHLSASPLLFSAGLLSLKKVWVVKTLLQYHMLVSLSYGKNLKKLNSLCSFRNNLIPHCTTMTICFLSKRIVSQGKLYI